MKPLPRQKAITKGYADTRWGQVHYRACGTAGPYLFLISQVPLSSRQFSHALPLLGRKFRAVALDSPGCGGTEPPPRRIPIAQYGRRLHAAIRNLTREPFALVGVSSGATIALAINAVAPDDVTGMVLLATAYMPQTQLWAMGAAQKGEPRVRPDGAHMTRMWGRRTAAWPGTDAATLQETVSEIVAVYPHFNHAQKAMMDCDHGALLDQVRCPTLFLSGEKDKLQPFNRAASRRVKGARHRVARGTAEPLFYARSDVLVRHIAEFLGRPNRLKRANYVES